VVRQGVFVDVHERVAETDRVALPRSGCGGRRDLHLAQRLRIRRSDDLIRAVELQAEPPGCLGGWIGSDGHVEQRIPLAEKAAGLMGWEDEDGIAGGRVVDARLGRVDA
jgi:hypothetical protein